MSVKTINVKCKRSSGGAFMFGEIYIAEKKGDSWFVVGVDGYSYPAKEVDGIAIRHQSETERFTFEKVI